MSDPLQTVKLGQSLFQDTFFVYNSQLTPYRKLRQLELEIRELDTAIRKAKINQKRLQLREDELIAISDDPHNALDLEELQIEKEGVVRLLEDAEHRKANFEKMKEQLLTEVPKEYWDQGFENAEAENWIKHFAKQLAICRITGLPNAGLIDQLATLPVEMTAQILLESKVGAAQFAGLEDQTSKQLLEHQEQSKSE